MYKRLSIFVIFFMLLIVSGVVFANEFIQSESNTVGWQFDILELSNDELTFKIQNNWKDRNKCTTREFWIGPTSYKGIYTFAFFTEEKLNYEKEKELDSIVWYYFRARGYNVTHGLGGVKDFYFNLNNLSFLQTTFSNIVSDNKFNVLFDESLGDFKKGYSKEFKYSLSNNPDMDMVYLYFVDHCGASVRFRGEADNFYDKKENLAKATYVFGSFNSKKSVLNEENESQEDADTDDSQETTAQTSSQNIRINLKNKIFNDYLICENKICYFKVVTGKESETNLSLIDLIVSGNFEGDYNLVTNKYSPENIKKENFPDVSAKSFTVTAPAGKNFLTVGSNLKYNMPTKEFSILNTQLDDSYFISVYKDSENQEVKDLIDYFFLIKVTSEEYNNILKYKTHQKIINEVYCINCTLPDWLPGGVNISELSCKYSGDYKILCDFSFFDLNQDINYYKIFNTGPNATDDFKKTFFLEIQHRYSLMDTNIIYNKPNVKLFFSELDNFNLSENEQKIFFSIIGGESSFNHNVESGLNENSFGFVQINESWNNKESYNKIEKFIVSEHKGFDKYQNYFEDIENVDANYSLYLGLAVFKYHLEIMRNTTAKAYNDYSNIEKAFMQFYKHQLSNDFAEIFFNGYDPNKKMIFNCDPNAENIWGHSTQNGVLNQSVNYNKLECVSTAGSVRKIAWYLFVNNYWSNLKNLNP